MRLFFHKRGGDQKEGKVAGKEGRIYTESFPLLLFSKRRWNLATCAEWMKGILWFMEKEILRRKLILTKFMKLAKNQVNRNTGDRSGKEIRSHHWPRIGETTEERSVETEGHSLFSLVTSLLLRNVFEVLGHTKCWKKWDHFNFILGISLCQYRLMNKVMRSKSTSCVWGLRKLRF